MLCLLPSQPLRYSIHTIYMWKEGMPKPRIRISIRENLNGITLGHFVTLRGMGFGVEEIENS